MTKKKLYLYGTLLLAVLSTGCNSVQQVLKSGRPEVMYQQALDFYEKGKWTKAATLFEGASPYYVGRPQEDSIAFMHAYCKFKNREYGVVTSELDLFRRKHTRSIFLEDAEGMLALSYFYLSPEPTRDQSMTTQALVAINEFMARYPESDKIDEFRKMDQILIERLHDKAFLNAYTYYKIERYKSAIFALKNALREYPESKHREEIMYLIVKSNYELAANSVRDKQTDRYLSMLDSYYSFVAEFPESSYQKELARLAEHARDYLDRNNKENTL